MTDAYADLHDDLETARAAVESALVDVRTAERSAWALYKGDGQRHQYERTWRATHEAAKQAGEALGQLDRACKAAANTAAGGSRTETTP